MDEPTNPYDAPQAPIETPVATPPDKDIRMWAMLCHLSALSFYFSGVGGIVGPLIVWMIKREDHPLIDDQGKESLNFEISMFIYGLVIGVISICMLGIPLLILLVLHIVFIIIAAIKANSGEYYRYPLTIRLIK